MSEINLAEIEARAEKATAGEWVVVDVSLVAQVGGGIIQCENGTDAEFIAHAREDVPALIAEVKKLQASFCRAMESATDLGLRGLAAKQENDKLRKALETVVEGCGEMLDNFVEESGVVSVRDIAKQALGGLSNGD